MMDIIQYWDGPVPDDVKELTQSWKDKNPNHNHIFFDKKKASDFMKKNFTSDIYEAFLDVDIPAMSCDIFRVAYILKKGGIYVDCGTVCNKPIKDWELDIDKLTLLRKNNGWVWNGFISSPPENLVIKEIWKKIEKSLLIREDGNIWSLTGPKLFMDVCEYFSNIPFSFVDNKSERYESKYVELIYQSNSSSTFSIINNLSHKKIDHWSVLQNIMPLYKSSYFDSSVITCSAEKIDKKIVIHIGQHETGSTSIQQSLYSSRDYYKYCYPSVGLKGSGHHHLFDIFSSKSKEKALIAIENFVEEVRNEKTDTVIISSEYFSSNNEIEFKKESMNRVWANLSLLSSYFKDVVVVYYVRDQVSSVNSRINQAIKSRICLPAINLKKILKNPTLNYYIFDKTLRKFFPSAKVVPRLFGSKNLESGLVEDFSMIFGGLNLKEIGSNKSIENLECLAECMKINSMRISVDEKMKKKSLVIDGFDKKGGVVGKNKVSLLSDDELFYIKNFYNESNKEFLKLYSWAYI